MANIEGIPLSQLTTTIDKLSKLLDPPKIIPTDENVPRDWTGLACFVNVPGEYHNHLRDSGEPTKRLIDIWKSKRNGTDSVSNLLEYLRKLDRYDIVDDLQEDIEYDIANYRDTLNRRQIPPCIASNGIPREERDFLTYEDMLYRRKQYYDAFVLSAEADISFAKQVVNFLKGKCFKVCTLCDLMAGFHTEHVPAVTLMAERCRKIIVIYSPAFVESRENAFYTENAQAFSIKSGERNIIPIKYADCDLPISFKNVFMLHFDGTNEIAAGPEFTFWNKLLLNMNPRAVIELLEEMPALPAVCDDNLTLKQPYDGNQRGSEKTKRKKKKSLLVWLGLRRDSTAVSINQQS